MKINRDSWHFKLNKFYSIDIDWRPIGLCKYFWVTVASLMIATAMALAALIALVFLAYPILQIWMGTNFGAGVISFFLWFVVLTFILSEVMSGAPEDSIWLKEVWKKKEKSWSIAPPKEPGLVTSYLRAKKAKVCPRIEFV